MRGLTIAALLAFALEGAAPAGAQGALDGPLMAPGSVASRASALSSHAKQNKGTPRQAAKTSAAGPILGREQSDRDARAVPRLPAKTADDPLSVGMKWNGSNDNGSQTRVQNYNGTAAGTGAEVGLKLHF